MRIKKFFATIAATLVAAMCVTGCGNINPTLNIEIADNEEGMKSMDFTDITSVELMKYMGNGINLGNTMEAVNTSLAKNLDTSSYETAWGQPVTTKEMILSMKECGFDTLRIPVAWTNMMDYDNDDYTINEALVERVAEIVDWAIEADMFVIVNDHWDAGWWDKFAGDETELDKAWKIYEGIWNQVGERFKDYPYTLILESANEELGNKWEGFGMSTDDSYKMMNDVNQRFVDIIRGQGGNNADRFLLIAGNGTDINRTLDTRFVMPSDTANNRLIVSVHYYDPWNYCGDKSVDTEEQLSGYRWGLKNEYEYASEQIGKLKKFVDDGYGVIIGEYGALCCYIGGKSYQIPNAVEYNSNVLDVCDVNGICPILWDCNNVFNKKALTTITPEMKELYTSRNYVKEIEAGDDYLASVQNRIDTLTNEAPENWPDQEVYEAGTPVAWIMWNGGAGTYSVGDTFNDADCTAGIHPTNTVINEDGKGEYTVSLDFDGAKDGLTFAALAIADGELLFPGAAIDIKEITMNGEPLDIGKYYTCSDDKKCMRVNLYNGWCGDLSKQIEKPDCNYRTVDGNLEDITATPINTEDMVAVENITITFKLKMPK